MKLVIVIDAPDGTDVRGLEGDITRIAADRGCTVQYIQASPLSEGDAVLSDPRLLDGIESLDLTVRAYNTLKRARIHTIGELVAMSPDDLMDIRNFTSRALDEIRDKLRGLGLTLKGDVWPPTQDD